MQRISRFIREHVDGVRILLTIFLLSLSFLFFYMQKIDSNIVNYYSYKKSIEKLHVYDQKFENIFMRSYRYLDNDNITKISMQFDRELIDLKKNKLISILSKDISFILDEIIVGYQKKTELIESFKTLNARITSSVFFLYELKKENENKDSVNIQIEELLGGIIYKIGQVFLDTDLETLDFDRDLLSLSLHRGVDKRVDYFYRHSIQFLSDVKLLKKVINENKELDLEAIINKMDVVLEKEFQNNKNKEDIITYIFFVLSVFILLLLLNTYLKVVKNRKEVFYLAYHDTLTGLPNRTEFERSISEHINSKYNLTKAFSVIFIDLDRFKIINDTLGHNVGDEMLIILAKRISNMLGEGTLLARIGGDEFVAILETDDRDEVDIMVAQIASVIRDTIYIGEYSLNTTASIGIARYPEDGLDKSTLLKHADSAMYHAKDIGRDTYAFYTKQLSVDIERRLELEQELVSALKKREFTLFFQPQYRLITGKISGAEALIRWNNSALGEVSPEEFISVAEDTGLIVELGYYIFREACSAYMKWKESGLYLDLIAINISSVQLRQPDAFMQFKKIIEDTGMDANNIEIELTERYIMEYTTEKLTILDDLRSLGCRISIDDFGTGYSSMSYLKSLEIDTIKIDKSFILDLPGNQHDAEVSKAIIVLSQSLGYEVIAEGIENIEQETLLKEFNCDMGQGFFFAKPMDSETLVKFYHEKNKRLN
ncbi:EAL domain-containing protein [Sulfurovum sp.]|uniref:EAL domain-containing protein n=1 Tax=Sulfurovum sp. TaxID=1969726 RepID=UPI002868346B|nr:EAL domain-containing protein [Sulfurovum sp.]